MQKITSNLKKLDDIINSNKIFDVKPLGNLITVYLVGEIGPAENYLDCFDIIRSAGENDVVRININSPGGDLFTTIQFLRALSETQAVTVASAEGCCMSAATMIFLSAQNFEISDHCLFMIHNYSGMSFGKGGEMYDQLINERKWSEKIIQKIYEGFLTKEEIDSVLNNKDLWMEGEEVMNRLKVKIEAEKQEAEKQEEKPATQRKPRQSKTPKATPKKRA
jgi:ATP-dependent protease ClpP protease subunit